MLDQNLNFSKYQVSSWRGLRPDTSTPGENLILAQIRIWQRSKNTIVPCIWPYRNRKLTFITWLIILLIREIWWNLNKTQHHDCKIKQGGKTYSTLSLNSVWWSLVNCCLFERGFRDGIQDFVLMLKHG